VYRYRLHSPDGDDLGEATYAMMIKPGGDPARRWSAVSRPYGCPVRGGGRVAVRRASTGRGCVTNSTGPGLTATSSVAARTPRHAAPFQRTRKYARLECHPTCEAWAKQSLWTLTANEPLKAPVEVTRACRVSTTLNPLP
jgi:hypothetical protein